MSDHQQGAISILAAAALWSTAGLFMGFLSHVDAWTILLWRSVFGAFFVGLIAFAWRGKSKPSAKSWGHWLIATTSSAVGMITFISALRLTSVANVAMIHASLPILSALAGAVLLRERPSRAILAFSAVAFVGALVIFIGSAGRCGNQMGNLLALLMTASVAVMTAALRAYGGSAASIIVTSNATAAAFAFFLSPSRYVGSFEAALLAGFALVQMALGLALYSRGARLLPSGEAGLLSLLEVPLSPFWVWLTFGQRPTASACLGGVMIVMAATGHIISRSRRSEEPRNLHASETGDPT